MGSLFENPVLDYFNKRAVTKTKVKGLDDIYGMREKQAQTKNEIAMTQRRGQEAESDIYGKALSGIDPSKMGLTRLDTRATSYGGAGRAGQMTSLQRMQQIAQGGMSAEEEAGLQNIRLNQGRDEKAQRDATLARFRSRGMGRSGAALAAEMDATSNAADRAAQSGTQLKANMFSRALNANSQAANLSSNIAGQDYQADTNNEMRRLEALRYNNQISDKEYNERKGLTMAQAGVDNQRAQAQWGYDAQVQGNSLALQDDDIQRKRERIGLNVDRINNNYGLARGVMDQGTQAAMMYLTGGVGAGAAGAGAGAGAGAMSQLQGSASNASQDQLRQRVYKDENGNWQTNYGGY